MNFAKINKSEYMGINNKKQQDSETKFGVSSGLIGQHPAIVDHASTLTTIKVSKVGIISFAKDNNQYKYFMVKDDYGKYSFPLTNCIDMDCKNFLFTFKRFYFDLSGINCSIYKPQCVCINNHLFFKNKRHNPFDSQMGEWLVPTPSTVNTMSRSSKLYFKDKLNFSNFAAINYSAGSWIGDKLFDFAHSKICDVIIWWTATRPYDCPTYPTLAHTVVIHIDGIPGSFQFGFLKKMTGVLGEPFDWKDFCYGDGDFALGVISVLQRSFIKDSLLDYKHILGCKRFDIMIDHIDIERPVPLECSYCDSKIGYKPCTSIALRNLNNGRNNYIISGGESNPGPSYSKPYNGQRFKFLCINNRIRLIERFPVWNYKAKNLKFISTQHYTALVDGTVDKSAIIDFWFYLNKSGHLKSQMFAGFRKGFANTKSYITRQVERIDNITDDFSYIAAQLRKFLGVGEQVVNDVKDSSNSFSTSLTFKVIKYSLFISSLKFNKINSVSFWMSLASFIHEMWSDFVNIFKVQESKLPGDPLTTQAGPFEALGVLLILKSLLPLRVFNILKDLPSLTTAKVLDDSTMIQRALDVIFNAPYKIISMLEVTCNIPPHVVDWFRKLAEMSPFSATILLKQKITECIEFNTKHPHSICEEFFMDRVLKLNSEVKQWRDQYLSQMQSVPKDMMDCMKRFEHLKNKVLYMKDPTRVEPVWCVFCGPPGTGKTTVMNWLLKGFESSNTIYVHAATDQKDFYDMYDGEDIFAVDDVGQKGIFQWSNMINFVSTTKFPLECAQAELKNTKFFVSNVIMSTTNNINLTITQNCGISDIQALWRRMHLFDFTNAVFSDGRWTGYIDLKRYKIVGSMGSWISVKIFPLGTNSDTALFRQMAVYIKEQVKLNMEFMHKNEQQHEDLGEIPRKMFAQGKVSYKDWVASGAKYEDLDPNATLEDVFFDAECDEGWWKSFPTFEPVNFKQAYEEHGLGYAVGRFIGCTTGYIQDLLCVPWMPEIISVLFGLVVGLLCLYSPEVPPAPTHSKPFKAYMSSRTTRHKLSDLRVQSDNLPHLARYKENVCDVSVSITVKNGANTTTKVSTVMGLMSQRCVLLPFHVISSNCGQVYITVSKRGQVNYDHQPVNVVYSDPVNDVCIVRMPRTVPVYYRRIKVLNDTYVKSLYLVNSLGAIDLKDSVQKLHYSQNYYTLDSSYVGKVGVNDVSYEHSYEGLCGALLMTSDGVMLGMHVAGCDTYGVAKLFSSANYKAIKEEFDKDECVYIPKVEISEDASRTVIDRKEFNFINNETTIVPSKMYGVFPVERAPANLKALGPKTVYVMDQKSHRKVQEIDEQCLKFATQYMCTILPKGWSKLTEAEIVDGNEFLNRVDKTTSCGYGFKGRKTDWIDYENKCLRTNLRERVEKLRSSFIDNTYAFDSYHATTLKDELRNIEKVDKPRAFKTTPIDILMLEREYLGNLLTHIHKNKFTNGIMVGINPFSPDWKRLYERVTRMGGKVFDGDYGKWDGAMLSQFQHALNDLIVVRSGMASTDKMTLEQLLATLVYTPTVTECLVSITTHSLPSGRGITADYNSMIGKMYDAYIFAYLYREKFGKMPTLDYYILNVYNAVYGDDKLVGVSDEVADWFNGKTYERIANMLGLDFTPADKGEWTYIYRNIEDCTFLKRGFKLHSKLGLVAPIEMRSMTSTLNFVKDQTLNLELTCVKILNFQREAFLHELEYPYLIDKVYDVMCERSIDIPFLPEEYLCDLYKSGDYDSLLVMY